VHIKQSTETQTASAVNNVGLYAENVSNFVAHTCTVSDFTCTSGCTGIVASGTGRIENCVLKIV